MEAKGYDIQVGPAIDAEGKRLEPEEMQAAEVIPVTSDLGMVNFHGGMHREFSQGLPVPGTLPTAVRYLHTVGSLAEQLPKQCRFCVHHDPAWFRGLLTALETSPDAVKRAQAVEIRENVAATVLTAAGARAYARGAPNPLIDALLAESGICGPLTEISMAMDKATSPLDHEAITPPEGHCEGQYFQPRDQTAERTGSQMYDAVMLHANDKKVGL